MSRIGKEVHVRDASGHPRYNRLRDHGGSLIFFESYGFVRRDDLRRRGWTVEPGWVDMKTWEESKQLVPRTLADGDFL